MKRSEAISHIVNVLRLTNIGYSDDGKDKQDADAILSRLEQIGMLPPFSYLKNLGTLDTAWEPEDE